MERIKLFIPLIVFVVLAGVFLSLERRMVDGSYDPTELPSALIGKPLPSFSLTVLEDENATKTQSDIVGPALLNVWATWCVSCRVEHGYLNQLAQRGIRIYGLNYKDEREAANRWLTRLGNPYVFNLFDADGKLGLNLGVYGAPETYVIDRAGTIVYRHVGILSDAVWSEKIQTLGLAW